MSEQYLLLAAAFVCGLALGVIAMLVFNKIRGGSVSPGALKQEMEDYQGQVEAHFEQTSQKFQQMATQYQDLYQHLAVGATSLCRPENISPGLSDQSDPLAQAKLIEQESASEKTSTEQSAKTAEIKSESTETADSKAKPDSDVDQPDSVSENKPSADTAERPSKAQEPSAGDKEPSAGSKEPSAKEEK